MKTEVQVSTRIIVNGGERHTFWRSQKESVTLKILPPVLFPVTEKERQHFVKNIRESTFFR